MAVAATMTPRAPVGAPARVDSKLALPVKLFLWSLFLPFSFSVGTLAFTSTRMVVLVMVLPLLFQLFGGKFGKLHLVDYMFVLHIFWMGVALSVNSPQSVVQQVGSVGPEFLGSYLIGRAYIRNRYQFFTLCRTLIWSVLLLLPLVLLESQTGRPYIIEFFRSLPGVGSHGIVTADQRLGLERVQGPFAHPIHFGLFCSITVPIAFFMYKDKIADGTRWFLVSLVFVSAFLSLSAGVLMALVAQIGLISWYLIFRNFPYRWALLTGILVLLYIIVDLLSSRTPIRVFFTYGTFSPHTAYWRGIIFEWGMMNIFGNDRVGIPPAPIFGIGLKDWVRPPYMYSGSMDNYWLVTGVRYGVPGFMFLAIGYFSTLWNVGRNKDFMQDVELLNFRRAWMFTFVGLTLTLCTVHIWDSMYSFVLFFFGSGVWMLNASFGGEDAEKATPETQDARAGRRGAIRYSRFPAVSRVRESKV